MSESENTAAVTAAELSPDASPSEGVEIRFWPLLLRLRKQLVSRGRWEVDSWSLQSCSSDRDGVQRQSLECTEHQVADQPTSTDYEWSGLLLQLYRDERAAYRFNLSARDPRIFVVCNEEEGLMRPFSVSASQDVASSYMDGGEEDVYSVAMPAAIQCWIEAFIARHGEPELDAGKSKRRHHGRRPKGGDKGGHKGARKDAEGGMGGASGSRLDRNSALKSSPYKTELNHD